MSKKREQKKQARKKRVKIKVLKRRTEIRKAAKLEKESDRIAWENRDRLTPIRNPKNTNK
tara:strand:+ start:104 stop:283 length:180 start_codon:yes stop_codon:yes gene_type:complete